MEMLSSAEYCIIDLTWRMWLKSRKHRTEVMMSGANDVKYMVTASHVIKPLYKGEHFS